MADAAPLPRPRLVAYFDVLGFGDRLQADLGVLHGDFLGFVRRVKSSRVQDADGNPLLHTPVEDIILAFDSVVAFTPLDGPDSRQIASSFVLWCVDVMQKSFRERFPLRGVLGADDVLWDAGERLFLASIQPEMVQMEKVQQWCGAVVLPGSEERVLDLVLGDVDRESDPFLLALVPHLVPTTGGAQQLWAVNWLTTMGELGAKLGLASLDAAKMPATRAFLRLSRRSSGKIRVPKEASPIKFIRLIRTGAGFQIGTFDSHGETRDVRPGKQIDLTLRLLGTAGQQFQVRVALRAPGES